MEHHADIITPLLEDHNSNNTAEDHLQPTSRHTSSEFHGDDRLNLQQLSGRWQFKLQSNLGKWIEIFDESEEPLSRAKQEYNRKQKATLQTYKEVDGLDFTNPGPDSQNKDRGENVAVNLSNGANIILLILKVYASVRSGSIAVIASTLDSLLDLLAGAILWFTRHSMRIPDVYSYPIGKSRVQPVGIAIFAAVMATLGVQVLIEAVRELMEHDTFTRMSTVQLEWLCSIMGVATFVKLCLFLYCRSFDNEIIQAYSKDHYFDVLTNVVGLAAALMANWLYWWIDPAGAIVLAIYTITNWSQTVLENAVSLIGKSAPPEVIQKLTYMALRHSAEIQRIDTVRAYTFGSTYFVEVDIQLQEEMPLKKAHDIGQSLQDKFERLPEVERAFVHLDHECSHKPEHSLQH